MVVKRRREEGKERQRASSWVPACIVFDLIFLHYLFISLFFTWWLYKALELCFCVGRVNQYSLLRYVESGVCVCLCVHMSKYFCVFKVQRWTKSEWVRDVNFLLKNVGERRVASPHRTRLFDRRGLHVSRLCNGTAGVQRASYIYRILMNKKCLFWSSEVSTKIKILKNWVNSRPLP